MRSRRTITALTALLVTAGLSGSLTGNGHAAPTAPLGPPPIEDAVPASRGLDTTVLAAPPVTASVGVTPEGLETDRVESAIAPGLTLTQFQRLEPRGWVRGDVLSVDLAEPVLEPAYLNPGTVSARTPLSEQADRIGAIAGVNGDFFDINATGAPEGVGVSGGEVLHGPARGNNNAVVIGGSGVERAGRLAEVLVQAEITLPDGRNVTATNLNSPIVAADGIGIYTPLWGASARHTAVGGAERVLEVEVRNGVVTALRPHPAEGPVPAGTVLLLARDAGVDALAGLDTGDRVEVRYRPRVDFPVDVAVGGLHVLVRDGEVQNVDDVAVHPRTAVGFSEDGRRMFMVTVDGRQGTVAGLTLRDLARLMKSLGAHDALNLDGGGSSTLVARLPGDTGVTVHNSPSDGGERPVPNGLGIATQPGSGRLTAFRVEPAVPGEHSPRVLAGLSRTLVGHGHDETGAPVSAAPHWRANPANIGKVDVEDGQPVFHARRSGTTTVTAHQETADGEATGRLTMTVLGPAVRLATDTERISLSGAGAQGRFRVLGYDAEGFGTWIEPRDVTLEYDPDVVRIAPDRDGFVVEAVGASGSTVITARVGDLVTHLGASVGLEARLLSGMDELAGWRASVYPSPVGAQLSIAEGHAGTPGIALDYRLTGTTATRAAYLNTDPLLPLPAGTQRIGLWVDGDGRGAWLRMTLLDSTDTSATITLADKVDWTGWRYVEAEVPAGLTGALRLQRVYVVETDPDRQYEGRVVFDDLTVRVSTPVDVPADPVPQDRMVVLDGALPAQPGALRVAVVSDAQFTADDPDGPLVAQARRTFREVLAARPDVVLINGDLVDRGTAADFELARRVIDEELGDRVPWYYLPGNHETYGPGDTSEFRKEFGPPHRVLDLAGVRLVLLDSSLGSLRAGGFDQVRMLRQALDDAAVDPGVRGVLVAMHHPVEDPGATDNSELADPHEAEMLVEWLADFRARSGKPAVSVAAHAGLFHVTRIDGVPYLVNGNSGKAPAAAPGDGGFTGWSLLRFGRDGQVEAELRPHVDDLRLTVPATLAVGERAPVTAVVVQGGREVPVAYPVSADWDGSPELHVGDPAAAKPWHVAAFDPRTGQLVGLRPGRAALTVTVNGVTQHTELRVG